MESSHRPVRRTPQGSNSVAEIDEFLDREYNTTLFVPNEDAYLQQWVERSAAARQQHSGHLDLAYGAGDKETLDLFPSQAGKKLLVFLHGGFWRGSDKSYYTWMVPPLVKAGVSVALLNYALCPAVTISTIVEQCRRGIAWLFHHAKDYDVSAGQIIVTGHSAGGHLAAMMFATNWSNYQVPDSAIVGGIALSGLFDLEPLVHTSINNDLRLDAESAKALSPVRLQPQTKRPLIAAVGALESSEFRRQTGLICDAWPGICIGPKLLSDRHHFSVLEALTDINGALVSEFQ